MSAPHVTAAAAPRPNHLRRAFPGVGRGAQDARAASGRRARIAGLRGIHLDRSQVALSDGACRTESDDRLGIGIDGYRSIEALREQLRDARDSRRPAGEQDRVHPVRSTAAASKDSARTSTVCAMPASTSRSNSDRVSRTLAPPLPTRTGTTASESNESDSFASTHSRRSAARATPVGGVSGETVPIQSRRREDMAENGVVEVRPAERRHAHGLADDRQLAVSDLADDDGIERAAAQVVDSQQCAFSQRLLVRVMTGGSHRFGDEFDVAPSLPSER